MQNLREVLGFDALRPGHMYAVLVKGEKRRRILTNEKSLEATLEELVRNDPHVELTVEQLPSR